MRLAQNLVVVPFFLLFAFAGAVSGQSRLYTSYTKADGLPSDYVMRIYQSPGGFMWFGTERGAAMYDGQSFTTYTTEDGLPHNLVYDILEDHQGRTWFATPIPTLAYLKNGKIHRYRDSVGTTNPISTMAIDRNNRILFRFHDGIGVLNGDAYEFHPLPMQVSKESNFETIADGRILLSDSKHILAVRLDTGTRLQLDTLYTYQNLNQHSIIKQASDSTIYITENTRVVQLRLDGDRLRDIGSFPVGFFTTMSVISKTAPYRLLLGNRTSGLHYLENGQFSPLHTSAGSDKAFISHHIVDYEGNVWVGFFGQGVEKITSWNARVVNEESGLPERNVWRVATHRGDVLTMGVGGIRRVRGDRAEPLPNLPITLRLVRGIHYTDSKVYIATMSDLRVYDYDGRRDVIGKMIRTFDFGDGVNDIRMADDGSMWVATAGMKLFRVMPDESIRHYPMKNGAERLINAGRAMWVLTSTDGAFRVEDEVFKAYSKATGDLPSNDVRSVHEDANGILIGTSAGLTRILPNGERITFDASNGLAGLPVISVFPVRRTEGEPAAYWVVTPNHMHRLVDSNLLRGNSLATLSKELSATHWVLPMDDYSTMLLGTGNGLVMYDLTQTGRSIPPPKVAIRAVSLNGTRFLPSPEGVIRQRASSSTLEFEFSGLTFVKESDTEFSYRLIDVDDDWSPAQRQRTVRYANIRPGTYTFEVRAINIDGVASTEVASIRIVIDPPWWMHPIMVIFLLLGSIAGLVAGIRWRVKTIQADIVKRNEQKQFEAIQRIGASISHDIKNTVFSLSLLSKNLEKRFDNPEFRKDAIETIESSLSYLSTLVNRLQEAPNAAASPITEIELRTLCTEIVKRVAGGSGRQVDIEMADSMRIRIHPEPIERILENLIRNAMEATPSGQSVRVMAVRQSNEVVIQVIDQGSGMSEDFIRNRLFKPFQSTKTKGLGIGLYSCKELADAMGATFEVESELGKGTTFRLRFVNSAS